MIKYSPSVYLETKRGWRKIRLYLYLWLTYGKPRRNTKYLGFFNIQDYKLDSIGAADSVKPSLLYLPLYVVSNPQFLYDKAKLHWPDAKPEHLICLELEEDFKQSFSMQRDVHWNLCKDPSCLDFLTLARESETFGLQ